MIDRAALRRYAWTCAGAIVFVPVPALANGHLFADAPLAWIAVSLGFGIIIGYLMHMLISRLFPDRSLIREALAAARNRPRTPVDFVDQATNAAMVLDLDGRIIASNINLVALMALESDRLAGKRAADVLPSSLVDGMMIGFETGLDSSGTFECVNGAGERLTVEIQFQQIQTDDGPVVGVTVLDMTEAKRREIELATLAFTDALTGLQNRLALTRRLSRLSDDLAEGPDAKFSLFLMDLNKFKPINDTYGHAVGDRLLAEVGKRIRTAVPRNATVARIGGDEFVVIAGPRIGREAAVALANHIIAAVSEPIDLGTAVVDVGVSIGIAIAPDDSADPDTLMMGADHAMYKAKRLQSGYAFMQDALDEPHLAAVA
ncbi:MAG: diguanylate cyclase domain-containing protein [Beijerinckiaceae bacterium]